jgi:cytidine deaminase
VTADGALKGELEQALTARAFEAMEQAYAPYSGFRVGAALLASDGTIVVGCNVENASYPAGTCAERGALAGAVVQGIRKFEAVVIATEAEKPASPCGICRQALVEMSPHLKVLSVTRSGLSARWTLAGLLPEAFTPASLEREPAERSE